MEAIINKTIQKGFRILAFSSSEAQDHFLFIGFFLMYLLAVLSNLMVSILVCLAPQLHTPMYFFLCILAVQDIISVTTILPKLMTITVTGDTSILFHGCLTQAFFYCFCTGADIILLAIMAYDRYVAICIPLRYYLIMSPRICILLVVTSWIMNIPNAMCFCVLISRLLFCRSHDINHFFCDIKILIELSCSDITHIQTLIVIELILIGLMPLTLILTSYFYIISAILKIKNSAARAKTFSSCSSHLTVVLLFFCTSLDIYMKPKSENDIELNKLLSLVYIGIVPMLNPLVYTLRNSQVWSAIQCLKNMC